MKITNRLEKLKAEKEIIQNMKCLSFDLRNKCLAWYDKEIECIERNGVKKMSRYIDADKIKQRFVKMYWQNEEKQGVYDPYVKAIEKCVDILDKQPTADVEEVRHGKWVKDKSKKRDDGEIYDYCCSRCCGLAGKNDYNNYSILSAYCPHCGAKMDGE